MKACLYSIIVVCLLGGAAAAEQFFLVDRDTGTRYGPFDTKHGSLVTIERQVFMVQRPGSETEARGMAVSAKLEAIKIPEIALREVSLTEALDFLKKASIAHDNPNLADKDKGINLIANLKGMKEGDLSKITFSAKNISLLEALKTLLQPIGLRHRIDGAVVFIEPKPKEKVE